jgi:hypothetical protein
MPSLDKPSEADSTIAAIRGTSLSRGLAWAIPLGVCGFMLPFVVFGVERVLRFYFSDESHFDRGLVADGAASAIICLFIFASSAMAHFTPCRGIGYIRSLIVMTVFAFVALIGAVVVWIFFSPFDHGNPKTAENFFVWFSLEYQYLLVFPVIFLPGAIGFTYCQISTSAKSAENATSTQSSIAVRQSVCQYNILELLLCMALILFVMTFLRPVFSQRRAQPLAEGVLLWHDQPIAGANVKFYPVLKGGHLGEPARQGMQEYTGPDGQYLIHTFPEWRKTNPTVGEFAVAVALSTDVERQGISAEEMDAMEKFASPQSTPIRVTIVAKKRSGIHIELSEWFSPKNRRHEGASQPTKEK